MQSIRSLVFAAFLLTFSVVMHAQQPAPAASTIDNEFVQKQFGTNCTMLAIPPVATDLDGDGIDDAVIAARCTSPMMDETEDSYRVMDPYNSFFGYGNPKVTTQFSTEDPERRGISLLVIHGSGPDAWRSPTPKAKFMLVNLPFREFTVKRLSVKKKIVMAIYIAETGGDKMTSAVFWDGKKYKYMQLGSTLE